MIAANAFLRRGFTNHTNVEEEVESGSLPLVEETDRTPNQPTASSIFPHVHDGSSESTSEEIDDTSTPSDVAGLTDRDTMAYVLGAMIHRLNCEDCRQLLTEGTAAQPPTSSFIAIMTYDRASLLNPKSFLVDIFLKRLKPIMCYIEKKYHHKHIAQAISTKFRLVSPASCCTETHSNRLMIFFASMLLRVFCKGKNHKIKQKDSKTFFKKMTKLNV